MAAGNSTDVFSKKQCGLSKELRSPVMPVSQKAEEQPMPLKYDVRTNIPTPSESEDNALRKV